MSTFFMRDRRFYFVFFSMTATIALQSAIVFAVNLADAIMLSRYSETALSGVALLNQVQFLLQMLVFGVAEGALIFSSRSWGEGKIEPIREVTNIALRFGVGLALLLSLLVQNKKFIIDEDYYDMMLSEIEKRKQSDEAQTASAE